MNVQNTNIRNERKRRDNTPEGLRIVGNEEFREIFSNLKEKHKSNKDKKKNFNWITLVFLLIFVGPTLLNVLSRVLQAEQMNLPSIGVISSSEILLSIALVIFGIIIFLKARG